MDKGKDTPAVRSKYSSKLIFCKLRVNAYDTRFVECPTAVGLLSRCLERGPKDDPEDQLGLENETKSDGNFLVFYVRP